MDEKTRVTQCEVVVPPAGGTFETQLVVMVAFVTIILCGCGILLRGAGAEEHDVPAWQVDAFSDLQPKELAIFNALLTSAPEIEMIHEDEFDWPSVTELAEAQLPPFVQDSSWRSDGRYNWMRNIISTEDKHIVLYMGSPGGDTKTGSFLLVMLHDHVKRQGNAGGAGHAPFEVWIHPSSSPAFPEMSTDQALINGGWREVVARKGEREMKKSRGEDYF